MIFLATLCSQILTSLAPHMRHIKNLLVTLSTNILELESKLKSNEITQLFPYLAQHPLFSSENIAFIHESRQDIKTVVHCLDKIQPIFESFYKSFKNIPCIQKQLEVITIKLFTKTDELRHFYETLTAFSTLLYYIQSKYTHENLFSAFLVLLDEETSYNIENLQCIARNLCFMTTDPLLIIPYDVSLASAYLDKDQILEKLVFLSSYLKGRNYQIFTEFGTSQ